ncbi:hypothetical protein IR083_22280 [Dysgonomonas sp. GY75]|uniref:nSTAND3 domain-containing NTPase n=1 Tax=Dysgonomonas sp. GY75 TaxID=2780419 RepID=UPI0018832222|nr:hypothetical protein [Dysgonomonas sp. GY75]MBF0651548.1 hypothetical protein [Dysgonomonas sp. GY75]
MQKYDLVNLEWQQFELLAYNCLRFDIGPSVVFIEGGSDKGRDFLYNGKTGFWKNENVEYKCIFQAKHKSKINSFSGLKKDLKSELNKVFVENRLDYNLYCLVTNITVSGSQYDELSDLFNNFISDNNLSGIRFEIYSYRNIEACIDEHDSIKWNYPVILKAVDFKHLIENILKSSKRTISSAWLSVFTKNRSNFIYTNIFEKAYLTLEEKNILIFSGHSKSGKTFNAEMLLLKYFGEKSYIPYKIDKIEDFDNYYDEKENQIFLFDDAFGKYNVDLYRADSFNRKMEYIYELVDEKHKCVFTSREYIYKAFINYADNIKGNYITKITVEVQLLTKEEKESILYRYYRKANPTYKAIKEDVLKKIINHKNFSPETIRSYFANTTNIGIGNIFEHLDYPDDYLKKDFDNLSDEKKITLLSTLLSLNGTVQSIAYSYNTICDDLRKPILMSFNDMLNELDGSMLKWNGSEYDFYHPSMFEFFVRFISKDASAYRKLLLCNVNSRLLNVIGFLPDQRKGTIEINDADLVSLYTGFERMIKNPGLSMIELNTLLTWISNSDIFLLKLKSGEKYNELKTIVRTLLSSIELARFEKEDIRILSAFFHNIHLIYPDLEIDHRVIENLLGCRKEEDEYWLLVFRIIPFMPNESAIKTVTRDWFLKFYNGLRAEINALGRELYGSAYPDFEGLIPYQKLIEEKRFKEAELLKKKNKADFLQKTNRNWFPKYLNVKEKMKVLKSSQPLGYKLYEELISSFSLLTGLEDHESNRYIFNKEKGWW